MPLVRSMGVGSQPVASAGVTYRRTIQPPNDSPVFVGPLLVYGCPRLIFYAQQTAGVLGATVQPEYAVRSVDGIGVPIVEWLPLGPPVAINPNTQSPWLANYIMPARLIRLRVIRPTGQVTALNIVIAADGGV